MFSFESIRSIAGSAPETWLAGSALWSVTAAQTEYTAYATNDGTTGETHDYSLSFSSALITAVTYDASQYAEQNTENWSRSARQIHLYEPSTRTEFVPAKTTLPTSAASTATITRNNTQSTVSPSFSHQTGGRTTADTSARTSEAVSTGRTENGSVYPPAVDGDGVLIPTSSAWTTAYTSPGANPVISSLASTLGQWTTATVSTNTDPEHPWQNTAWTTGSYTLTAATSTNATQPATSTTATSWTLTRSLAVATSHSTETLTTPITYSADETTYHTRTLLFGTETLTAPVTTETVTGHAFPNSIETIVLMRGGRDSLNYPLGDMLWHFTGSALAASASTTGRMADLFASTDVPTVTLSDYGRATTETIAVTQITVSRNTVATTTATVTGTPPATGTASTATTVFRTSKNGAVWREYETVPTGVSFAASNTSTDSHVFSIGAVGTSLSTWTYGDPVSTASSTLFTHSVQVTGYSDTAWTSDTTTAEFASSSFTASRLALYSSVSSTRGIVLRSTTTDAALIASYSTYPDGDYTQTFLLGRVSTETTRVFPVATTTTFSLWDAHFNSEVSQWTTQTSYSLANGSGGSTSGVSQHIQATHHTASRLLPRIRSTPDGLDAYGFTAYHDLSLDVARHRCLPNGFAGFGGSFAASAVPVFFTISAARISGSAFSGQEIHSAALPSVSAYSGVTLFPVHPALSLSIDGAVSARYLATISGIGTASLAVTWTSTTQTGTGTASTATLVTSLAATYALAGASPIAGSFFSDAPLVINSAGGFHLLGGFGLGENALGHPYEVRCRSGYAAWTEFATSQSTGGIGQSTSAAGGTVSFSVPASHAIVFSLEPILTVNWSGPAELPFVFASTPHVPYA